MEKTKPITQQKHAFTNQRKRTVRHKINTKKLGLKPGLVAFYDIQPGHGAGLFSEEKISRPKGEDK